MEEGAERGSSRQDGSLSPREHPKRNFVPYTSRQHKGESMGSVTFGRERLLHHMTIARAMSVRHPSRCFPSSMSPNNSIGIFSYVPEAFLCTRTKISLCRARPGGWLHLLRGSELRDDGILASERRP
jgi:hypothetical protein